MSFDETISIYPIKINTDTALSVDVDGDISLNNNIYHSITIIRNLIEIIAYIKRPQGLCQQGKCRCRGELPPRVHHWFGLYLIHTELGILSIRT